jgi:hypothetical protein
MAWTGLIGELGNNYEDVFLRPTLASLQMMSNLLLLKTSIKSEDSGVMHVRAPIPGIELLLLKWIPLNLLE